MRLVIFALGTLAAALGLALAACSSSSNGGGGGSDPFVGSFACTNTFTWTYTTPANWPQYSGTSSYSNSVTDTGNGTYSDTITTDAGASCTLKHTYTGDTSTLVSGQTCTFGAITYAYTSGTATTSGITTSGNDAYNFTGTVTPDGGTATMVAGTGTGSSNCLKQ